MVVKEKNEVKFTTWEQYQFSYIEKRMKRKLTEIEKMAIIIKFGWRTTA